MQISLRLSKKEKNGKSIGSDNRRDEKGKVRTRRRWFIDVMRRYYRESLASFGRWVRGEAMTHDYFIRGFREMVKCVVQTLYLKFPETDVDRSGAIGAGEDKVWVLISLTRCNNTYIECGRR